MRTPGVLGGRRRRFFAVASALIIIVTASEACSGSGGAPKRPAPIPSGPRLIWQDNFDGPAGSAPSSAWTTVTGGSGWGNSELECYTSARGNSELDGSGDLTITALHDPGHVCSDGQHNDYTSARLTTQGTKSFEYGHIEVRAKMPTGYGIWPAFWALGSDHDTSGWPASGEIDVTEVLGRQPQITHGSLHGPDASGQPYDVTGQVEAPVDLSTEFHVYSVDWAPESISFALDGKTFYTALKADVASSGRWVFDHPFYLLLNVAVGGSWALAPKATTTWPQVMTIDYVRVYSH